MKIDFTNLVFINKIKDITFEDAITDCIRYRKLKGRTNVQFLELFIRHLKEHVPFDDIVDEIDDMF